VTRNSTGEWSDAKDKLVISLVSPPNETTFSPGFPFQESKNVQQTQSIKAFFDDVYTNDSLYDDFTIGFDATKVSFR